MDIEPWIELGNSPHDTTTKEQRQKAFDDAHNILNYFKF